jgi:hypothetical protein
VLNSMLTTAFLPFLVPSSSASQCSTCSPLVRPPWSVKIIAGRGNG